MQKFLSVSDQKVLLGLRHAHGQEREKLTEFLPYLSEFDQRRLYAPEAYSSTYNFCVQGLGLSEMEACSRIKVAGLGRLYPEIGKYCGLGKFR